MSGPEGVVAVIAPMPSEMRPVARRLGLRPAPTPELPELHVGRAGDVEVVATTTGIGPERAAATTARLLEAHAVSRVVVSGIAGGVHPATGVGDLVVAAEVVDAATGDRFRATPAGAVEPTGLLRTGDGSDYELQDHDVARLGAEGVVALDMETAAVARECHGRGVPWIAFRAISDMAGDASLGPVVMTLVDADGSPRLGVAIRHLLTHPWLVPRFARLGRDAGRASDRAAAAADRHIREGLGPVTPSGP